MKEKPFAGRTHRILSPLFLIISALLLIFLLCFFVITTLASTLDRHLEKRLEVVYKRYDERERAAAKDGVEQFIMGINYAVNTSPLPYEQVKKEVFNMLANGTMGVNSASGYFVFDSDNICIISQDYPEIIGRTADEIAAATAVDLGPELKRLRGGGLPGFIDYRIDQEEPEAVSRVKTAYISYVKEYDWVLGAGFFRDGADTELEEQLDLWLSLGEDINRDVNSRLFIFSLILFLLIIFVVFLLYQTNKARESINRRHMSFERALEESLCVIFTDSEGRITRVNEKYLKVTGRKTAYSLIGEKYFIDYEEDELEKKMVESMKKISKGKNWNGLVEGRTVNGEPFWLQVQAGAVRDHDGRVTGYVVFGSDVTDLHKSKNELEKSFLTDSLTGFGNRTKLLSDYNTGQGFLIAMYNIDGFSSINRFYGMEAADRILVRTSVELHSMLDQDKESLYRISADTFVVLCCETEKNIFILESQKRLSALNRITINLKGSGVPITVRCGLSVCRKDTLIIADAALSSAKNSSDGFIVYSEADIDDHNINMEKLEKLNRIRMAINNSEVYIVFQPIMCFKTGKVMKYECLIRMRDDDGTVLNPDEFINLAKEGRLYKKLTCFVIEKSFEVFSRRPEDFSINLTLEDFMDNETIDYLTERAGFYGIADRLILEIVETEELKDFEGIIEIINILKRVGIRIAIDDFGSGFSNFNYLLQINADFIKIDGSLIRNILTDVKSHSLVSSIIQFAKKLDMLTIAEYIEEEDLLRFARSMGIDYGQGYYIGKPDSLIYSSEAG